MVCGCAALFWIITSNTHQNCGMNELIHQFIRLT